ncbi:MAG: T9SS type A sorting domain-containing protein [Chitinophagales bacterium]
MKKNLLTLILLITAVCWSNSVFAQPANNECSGAEVIATAPGFPLQFGPYDNSEATSEASDPANPGFPDESIDNTTWYTFTGDGNAYFIYTSAACAGFDIPGDDYIADGDSQIAVYTGGCDGLELLTFDEDNVHVPEYDANGNYPAGAIIETEMGVDYHIMVDGYAGSAGQFCIVVTDWVCEANIELAEGQETSISICSDASAEIAINEATLNFGGMTIGVGLEYGVSWQMTGENPEGTHPRFHPSFLGFVGTDFVFNGQPDGTDPFGFGIPCIWLTPTSVANIGTTGSAFLAFDCQAVATESIEVCFIADGEGDCVDQCAETVVELEAGTPTEVTLCLDETIEFRADETTLNFGLSAGVAPTVTWFLNDIDPMGNPLGVPAENFLGFINGNPLALLGDGEAGELWVTCTIFEDYNDEDGATFTCRIYTETIHITFLADGDPACDVVACEIEEGDAGMLSTDDVTTICVGDGEADMISFTSSYDGMGSYGYLVTDDSGIILSPGIVGTTEFSNDFDDAGTGTCLVWGFTWEGEGFTDGFTMGADVLDVLIDLGEDACFDLTDPIEVIREACAEALDTSDADTTVGEDSYVVSFTVTGGETGDYTATGGTVDMNGLFTSDPIACGTSYSITITDGDESVTVEGDAPCEAVVVTCPIELVVSETCDGENGTVTVTIVGGTAPYTSFGTFADAVEGDSFSFSVPEGEEYNLEVIGSDDCGSAFANGELFCSKCKNDAGALGVAGGGSATACGGSAIDVVANGSVIGGENTTSTSVIMYILHSDADDVMGSTLGVNSTGSFSVADAGGVGTYFVTAYVGVDEDGDGAIDFFGDECTVSSDSFAITFSEGTDLTITAQEDCDEDAELVTVNFTVTGGADGATYAITGTFEGTVGAEGGSFSGIADGATYTINAVEVDGCGTGSLTSEPVICQKEDAVEWLSFDGEVQATGNFLQWMTASETNNEYFAVERSLDGKNFEVIAVVEAAGESAVPTAYNHLDRSAPAGTSYYRVTQFDFDGQNDATNVISLVRGEGAFGITNVRPVPAADYIQVSFSAISNGSVELSVYDLTGRVMMQTSVDATTGINNQTIDISAYPVGIYMVSLNNGSDVATQRLIKE